MERLLFILCLCVSIYSTAQTPEEKGIEFSKDASWQAIVKRAKAENKMIFVDCYTTWCAPCKVMEKDIYPLKEVGTLFNTKFISVKIQFDSTKNDSDEVKNWYKDALALKKQYSINAYPTFLFFTPEGKIKWIESGARTADKFINLANDVINSTTNYYELLDAYNKGNLDFSKMAFIARYALLLKDTATSRKVANDYLAKLKKQEWFDKDNLWFLSDFTNSSKDKGFTIFYKYADTINKIMGQGGFAQNKIQSVIFKDIVTPKLIKAAESGTEPAWNIIYTLVKEKYGVYYGQRLLIYAKQVWYHRQKDWPQYTENFVAYIDKYVFPHSNIFLKEHSDEDLYLNNYAWEVFEYSQNKRELTTALAWSLRAVTLNPNPGWIDTYANLLYKLGHVKLAIKWEEIASWNNKSFIEVLEKMRRGEPTWPVH